MYVVAPVARVGAVLALCLFTTSAMADTVLFSDDFESFTGGLFNGAQFESGLTVAYDGNLSNWAKTGGNAVHVVDTANVFPSVANTPNYAAMIWRADTLTLTSAVAGSNESGETYLVSFDASPAVYQAGSQQTSATNGLLFELLRGDNSVLASHTHLPGAWAGTIDLTAASFFYNGDGSGDLRLRVGPSELGEPRFGGAIDNLQLAAVPEPGAATLMLTGLGMLAVRRRRRRTQSA